MMRGTKITLVGAATILAGAAAYFWGLAPLGSFTAYLSSTTGDADTIREYWPCRLVQPEWVSDIPSRLLNWHLAEEIARLALVAGLWLLSMAVLGHRKRHMNLKLHLRTTKGIWLGMSILLFGAAWFPRGGRDEPAWEMWRVLLTHRYICSDSEMLIGLGIYTLVFAVSALLAGWLLQFPVCVALGYFHRGSSKHEDDIAQPEHCRAELNPGHENRGDTS
jgi:hypothetical protein